MEKKRKYRQKSKILSNRFLNKHHKGKIPVYDVDFEEYEPRPVNYSECRDVPGPCPWIGCRYNLYLDVNPKTGTILLNFPELNPWELKETCALRAADEGGMRLAEVGNLLNVSRESIRITEAAGLIKLRKIVTKDE